MPDREKVIKGLESCIANNCRDCPYPCYCEYADDWPHELHKDILELLKEQEATKPTRVNTNYEQHWNCGNCNAVISGWDKFCHECGKPIAWEGR